MVSGLSVVVLLEARRAKKGGSIPGPVIGWLMKRGVIGNRKFRGKKNIGRVKMRRRPAGKNPPPPEKMSVAEMKLWTKRLKKRTKEMRADRKAIEGQMAKIGK